MNDKFELILIICWIVTGLCWMLVGISYLKHQRRQQKQRQKLMIKITDDKH